MLPAPTLAVMKHAHMGVGSAHGAMVGWTPSDPPAFTSWEPIGYADARLSLTSLADKKLPALELRWNRLVRIDLDKEIDQIHG